MGKLIWLLQLARKNMWRNRLRTLITATAIFFAVILSVLAESLKQGWGMFFATMDAIMPAGLKFVLYIGIFIAQLLCGLATVMIVLLRMQHQMLRLLHS